MENNRTKIQPLTATAEVIRANIDRVFGGMATAIEETGISRSQWYKMLEAGTITDQAIGRIYRAGVEPTEMVKPT